VERVFQDDLPTISAARLRANDTITAETKTVVVKVGEGLVELGLSLVRFPNGGSWSLFVAPCCGRRAKALRLYDGRLLCRCCLRARGVLWRCELTSPRRRAEMRIPKLKAMLESETSLRRKPVLWGTMERRKQHEAALARCEYIAAKARFKRRVKDDAVHSEIPRGLSASRSRSRAPDVGKASS
jgi:hypothetical protein